MKTSYHLLEHLLRYKQVLLILTAILIITGIFALVKMPRDEFPEFKIRQGLIIGIFPGASSHQVEEQLTSKVENYLFRYRVVNRSKTYSISRENVMVIFVEVSEKEKDLDAFWVKLRHGLNELKRELPAGVLSLTADNDFGNTSAMLLAVWSDTRTYKELEDYTRRFEDHVRRIPSVSAVKHYGLQREQISVYIDDAKLVHYGIKPLTILAALKPQTTIAYAGEVDDGHFVRPIHLPASFKTEQDVANQIIYSSPGGSVIRMKDVARVVREYEDPDSQIRVNGKKCLIIALEMQTGTNIVEFGKQVNKQMQQFSRSLPADIRIETVSNTPNAVASAIHSFLKDFAIAIVSVIIVTILLLPFRVALVAAATIPISILATLGIMWIIGLDLQTVSLATLIIVLGMVVDNAIVIIDNYVEKLDHDISPAQAASQSVTDLFGSVFSATLILIFCFVPNWFFMTGMAKDFVSSMPMTITLALFSSLATSAVLVPILSYTYIKCGLKNDSRQGRKAAFLAGIQKFYDTWLEKAFSRKKIIVMTGLLSFAAGLGIFSFLPLQPFPKIERNQFAVEVYLPQGSSLGQTNAILSDLESTLRKDSRVKLVASFVGTTSTRFHTLYTPNVPAKNYGQLIVLTTSNRATVQLLDEYSRKYENHYPLAQIKWKQLEMSFSNTPIEIRISGESIETIKKIANQAAEMLRNTKGTLAVRTDYAQALQTINVDIKKDEAGRLGYSNASLGYALMAGTRGFPVATVWEGDYPVDVKLKIDKKIRSNVEDIHNLYVMSPLVAASVPLRQLAELKPGWTEGDIVRRNGVHTITVRADIQRGVYASTVLNSVKPKIDQLPLPDGVRIEYGGEHSDGIEIMTPMYHAMAVSIAIIFLILMAQFRNVKTSLLIMLTMPLTIFGAAVGLLLTGYPISVTALIGITGLMGIVIRNGIIYISYAEELRKEQGLTLEEAAIAAAKRRMRPIFLTAAAAAVGVIPMILSGSSLWGPLGSVICFGLMFGLVLSLIVVPVLYYYFHLKESQNHQENATL